MSTFRRLRSLVGWSAAPQAHDRSGSAFERQRAERVLAAARVFFAASALTAVLVDPTQPARYSPLTYTLLTAYLVVAIGIWGLLARGAPTSGFQWWTHTLDLLWAAL